MKFLKFWLFFVFVNIISCEMITDEENDILLQFSDIIAQTTTEVSDIIAQTTTELYDEKSMFENMEVKASIQNQSGHQITVMTSTVATTLTTTKIMTQTTTKKQEENYEYRNKNRSDTPVDYSYEDLDENTDNFYENQNKTADYVYENLNATFDYIDAQKDTYDYDFDGPFDEKNETVEYVVDDTLDEKINVLDNIFENKSGSVIDFVLDDESEMSIEYAKQVNDSDFDEQFSTFWETYFTDGNFSIDKSIVENTDEIYKTAIKGPHFFQHINVSELNSGWFEKELQFHDNFEDIEISDQFELDFALFPKSNDKSIVENTDELHKTAIKGPYFFQHINVSELNPGWFEKELQSHDNFEDIEISDQFEFDFAFFPKSNDKSKVENTEEIHKTAIKGPYFFQHINVSELNPEWFEKELQFHDNFEDIEISDQFELDFAFFPKGENVNKEKKGNEMRPTRIQSKADFNKINISDDFIDWFKAEIQDFETETESMQLTGFNDEDAFEKEFDSFWDSFNTPLEVTPMKTSIILNAITSKPQFEKINISGEALKWFKSEAYQMNQEKYTLDENYDDNTELLEQFDDILVKLEEISKGEIFYSVIYFLFLCFYLKKCLHFLIILLIF